MSAHRFTLDAGKAPKGIDPGTGNSFEIAGRSILLIEMISSGASETRTLPIPFTSNQILTLVHAQDGGDIDLTVTSGFDEGGDTTMNFATAGDFVTFISVATAATTYRWRILGFEGVTGITEVTAQIDLNGLANGLVLDADGDTTLGAPTDDQMDFKAGGTNRFRITESQAYDVDFNPALRVYRRQQMGQAIKSALQRNDWSVFTSVRSANLDWIVAGSGAGASTGYGTSADSDGGVILSHTATSSSFMWIKPADGGIFDTVKWGTSKNPRMRVVMQTGSNVTGSQFVCGLYSAATSPNRFDGTAKAIRAEVVFNQVVATSWKVDVAGTGSSSVSGDTSTAVAVSTVYDIDIRVQSDRTVVVYINGVLVYTSVKVLTATKNLIPMIGLQNRTTFHRPIKIYHVELSQDIAV